MHPHTHTHTHTHTHKHVGGIYLWSSAIDFDTNPVAEGFRRRTLASSLGPPRARLGPPQNPKIERK